MKKAKINVKTANPADDRGCCCKRSACRKKYCECFRTNVLCTHACKCIGCGNTPAPYSPKPNSDSRPSEFTAPVRPIPAVKCKIVKNLAEKPPQASSSKPASKKELKAKLLKEAKETEEAVTQITPAKTDEPPTYDVKEEPISLNFINAEVVDATVECMLAQAQECTENGLSDIQIQRMVLEEFDRSLVGILAAMQINEDVTGQQFL